VFSSSVSFFFSSSTSPPTRFPSRQQNKYGTTALIMAASEGHPKAIVLLVKNGAEVNHQADGGMGAVHFAAKV
jgi:ankyrin repeat protein